MFSFQRYKNLFHSFVWMAATWHEISLSLHTRITHTLFGWHFFRSDSFLNAKPAETIDHFFSSEKFCCIHRHIYSDREIHVITSSYPDAFVLSYSLSVIFSHILKCLNNFSKQIKIKKTQVLSTTRFEFITPTMKLSRYTLWNACQKAYKHIHFPKASALIQNNWNSIANGNVNWYEYDVPAALEMA